MSTVLLGATLPQFTGDAARFAGAARRAEELGLDSLWVFDHMWPLGGVKERPILECWTSLGWLASATTSIRIGSLVTRSSVRAPALLAKMIATTAAISNGRLTVGIGSGDELNRAENESFGLPFFEQEERHDQLSATAAIVRSYLDDDRVSHDDLFASVTDLVPSPRPGVKTLLWLGGRSTEIIELAGRIADGWNGWRLSPRSFARAAGDVVEAAAGRALELSWGGEVILAPTDDAARDLLGGRDPANYVVGGPETVARHLSRLVDAGARHLIAAFPDGGDSGSYELLAGPVRAALDRG
ncbi:MAG: LLM class flavin-dependent oxidoreductase [Actinomycetota bacterium]|nr:LLM class flavin-dependent oxidoreductase [Actinomycetota bacterium]